MDGDMMAVGGGSTAWRGTRRSPSNSAFDSEFTQDTSRRPPRTDRVDFVIDNLPRAPRNARGGIAFRRIPVLRRRLSSEIRNFAEVRRFPRNANLFAPASRGRLACVPDELGADWVAVKLKCDAQRSKFPKVAAGLGVSLCLLLAGDGAGGSVSLPS